MVSHTETFNAGELVFALVVQVGITAALSAWGNWVAERWGGTRVWRILSRVPWISLVLGMVGMGLGVWMLIRAFDAIASVDASLKATRLAESISLAMKLSAPPMLLAILGNVVCLIAFAIGTLRAPRDEASLGR